jgi:hypothetical protein
MDLAQRLVALGLEQPDIQEAFFGERVERRSSRRSALHSEIGQNSAAPCSCRGCVWSQTLRPFLYRGAGFDVVWLQ